MDVHSLVVFEELRVHKLDVGPKRVKATYQLKKMDAERVENDLIYSYDKKYFNKKDAEDINLASLMVAQVALNYGLFCKTIVFDGLYEQADKRFLMDMMENTSREILTNKFLEPNPFLKEAYTQLMPIKLDRYTAAEIRFENSGFETLELSESNVETLKDHYGILSSGGKDSLLTYGLIQEIGVPHAVFINESGRHWFTAINACKHLLATDTNTAKPWCNSDRIFNWMVRQMPFIRENFQQIRADIYPIRLWTVAVFLFGVLPIARKRRLGNILIGNEYDTTLKGNLQGISHYSGLYDQSKYFDNALTRFYRQKGWNMAQYSILRSLSELLILKILVKRYPELQRLQVSCHAAHEEDGRMRPCGNCEKCRRIIGMLYALGENPERCGYTAVQIQNGLKALSEKKVKQIGSDASHLYYLLLQGGILPDNDHVRKLARNHPRIMQLRFDKERSSLADLPKHIRRPLINIYREYIEGLSMISNKKWHSIQEEDLDFNQPYNPLKKEHYESK